jgi:hypothetical protein
MKLPAVQRPFGFTNSQLKEHLESFVRNEEIREQAFWSYAFQDQARENFLNQVMNSTSTDKDEVYVAYLLSLKARLTAEGKLEVREGLSKYRSALKSSWKKMKDAIERLEKNGFIKIWAHGSGRGHPYHIELTIKPPDVRFIEKKAADEINRHLSIEDKRSTLLIPISEKSN